MLLISFEEVDDFGFLSGMACLEMMLLLIFFVLVVFKDSFFCRFCWV